MLATQSDLYSSIIAIIVGKALNINTRYEG